MPVSVSSDALRIDGFKTSERDIVSYFIGLPDLEDMDKKLETLIKLGILTQGSAGTVIRRQVRGDGVRRAQGQTDPKHRPHI